MPLNRKKKIIRRFNNSTWSLRSAKSSTSTYDWRLDDWDNYVYTTERTDVTETVETEPLPLDYYLRRGIDIFTYVV